MAAKTNLLSDRTCKNAVCGSTSVRKLHDGGGLYLWVYALRLYGRIVGSPDQRNMKLMAGFIRESANSDEESEEPDADG